MIEITETQRQALAQAGESPPRFIDPATNTAYVLVRADFFEHMRKIIEGFSRRAGWDDPELDVYEHYQKQE